MEENLQFLKNLNLLYAEDSDSVRNEYVEVFRGLFRTVYVAKNGSEALELYEKKDIDIVVTDNRMPIMDGLELTQEIREEDDDTPIVIMTSFSEKDELLKATRLRLVDYMIKPVTYSDMKKTLLRCVGEIEKKRALDLHIYQGITYSPMSKKLMLEGVEYILQMKESLLLELFLRHRGRVVTREMIADRVYDGEEMSEGGVKNLVLKLREKLGKDSIQTLRGSGYILK